MWIIILFLVLVFAGPILGGLWSLFNVIFGDKAKQSPNDQYTASRRARERGDHA